eukprot:COSAG06_NODE_6552_length_2887_cov_289.061041_5_plen_61_part_00
MLSLSRMQRSCRRLARVRPPAPPSAAYPRLLRAGALARIRARDRGERAGQRALNPETRAI